MLGKLPIEGNINNAKKIVCIDSMFGEIIVDKNESKILNNGEDITDKCKAANSDNLTLGNVLYKMLNNQVDEDCRKYIRLFDGFKLY